MGLVTNPTTGTTIGTEYTIEADPGILVGLSAFLQPPADQEFQVFVAIGVKSSDGAYNSRRVQLASGYLRQQFGVTWTGFYPLASGDLYYLFVKGISSSPVELSDRRLTPETQILPGVTLRELLKTT